MSERDESEWFERFLAWRGVEVACHRCSGAGLRHYGNTGTWRGGVGGQSITIDICDVCWGSGDQERPCPNLRLEMERAKASRPVYTSEPSVSMATLATACLDAKRSGVRRVKQQLRAALHDGGPDALVAALRALKPEDV